MRAWACGGTTSGAERRFSAPANGLEALEGADAVTGVAPRPAMLDRNEPISSEVQDEAGSTPGGTMPGMGGSTTILAELLAEVRRQTGLLERAHREREREPRALLSKREAARLLGVSRGRTLDALLSSGQVRAVHIGRRLRVPLAEIERFQAEGGRRPGINCTSLRSAEAVRLRDE